MNSHSQQSCSQSTAISKSWQGQCWRRISVGCSQLGGATPRLQTSPSCCQLSKYTKRYGFQMDIVLYVMNRGPVTCPRGLEERREVDRRVSPICNESRHINLEHTQTPTHIPCFFYKLW